MKDKTESRRALAVRRELHMNFFLPLWVHFQSFHFCLLRWEKVGREEEWCLGTGTEEFLGLQAI